ncbi:hypothetical protein [Streptomyces sp. NPDC000410]|uniref:hypothetical protein n=1 Tax=Streptomyces sp. NPDC000410 TaxID=3154254 RepID=UPI003323E9B1
MPDHFDRLLARYAAPADAAPAPTVRRVRPRLPGPFERIEALRTAAPEPDEPAALVPTATRGPASGPAELVRHEREVRTDRHTVVRTDAAARPGEPERPAPPAVAAPLLRPAAHAAARPPHPVAAFDSPRTAAGPASPAVGDVPRQGPGDAPPRATGQASPGQAAGPVRPRGADTTPARGAARGGLGRRAPRPAERVVHVQIGRLEVSAAPPPGAGRTDRPDRTVRRAPALTLDDYLARGEKRD